MGVVNHCANCLVVKIEIFLIFLERAFKKLAELWNCVAF